MIICSCNILTDQKVKEYLQGKDTKPSVGTVLKDLDCGSVCGTCANSISVIVREHYESLHRSV